MIAYMIVGERGNPLMFGQIAAFKSKEECYKIFSNIDHTLGYKMIEILVVE